MRALDGKPVPTDGNLLVCGLFERWLKEARTGKMLWMMVLAFYRKESPRVGYCEGAGNDNVCRLLESCLTEARKGQQVYALVMGFEDPAHFDCEYAGAIGYDFQVNRTLSRIKYAIEIKGFNPSYDDSLDYAIDTMKLQVINGGLARELPPSLGHGLQQADHVVYNLGKAALSFDYVAWLVDAEMTRVREGAPAPLKVCFFNSVSDSFGAMTEHGQKMINNVARPMLRLIGAVETPAISGRSKEYYTYRYVSESVRLGEKVPAFSATGRVLRQMAGWTDYVTITLRECDYWLHRNSNMDAWTQFARYLQQQGERVVFIRDTAVASEPMPGFPICPEASNDIECRMAVYQQAKANFFVSNGPWNLALFSDKPWICFVTVDTSKEYDPREPETHAKSEWWQKFHGIKAGEQFPWCTPDQRIIWETDTVERMVEAWHNLGIEKCEKLAAISS